MPSSGNTSDLSPYHRGHLRPGSARADFARARGAARGRRAIQRRKLLDFAQDRDGERARIRDWATGVDQVVRAPTVTLTRSLRFCGPPLSGRMGEVCFAWLSRDFCLRRPRHVVCRFVAGAPCSPSWRRSSSGRSGSCSAVAAARCSRRPFPTSASACSACRSRSASRCSPGAYAFGPISGGHFNPAVSVGLWAGGRFPASLLLPYIVAQVVGRRSSAPACCT